MSLTPISRLVDLSSDLLIPYYFAFEFEANAGAGSYSFLQIIPVNMLIVGAESVNSGITAGDYIKVDITDEDNLLGLGAGFVLATPVFKLFLDPSGNKESIQLGYPLDGNAGFWIKTTYTTANAAVNAKLRLNVIANKVL